MKITSSTVVFFDFESMFYYYIAQWRCEMCLACEKELGYSKRWYTQEAVAQDKDIEYPKDKCRCGKTTERSFQAPTPILNSAIGFLRTRTTIKIQSLWWRYFASNTYWKQTFRASTRCHVIYTGSKVMNISIPGINFIRIIARLNQFLGNATLSISKHFLSNQIDQGIFALLL